MTHGQFKERSESILMRKGHSQDNYNTKIIQEQRTGGFGILKLNPKNSLCIYQTLQSWAGCDTGSLNPFK